MDKVDASNEMWTPERKKILNGLSDLPSPIPSQLYKRAIDQIAEYSSTSASARVDLALIGQCIRELMNGLPEYISGDKVGKSNYNAEREAISKLEHVLVSECDDTTFQVGDNAEVAVISASVANALEGVRREANIGSNTNRQKASLALLGRVDERNPALIPWMKSHGFFQSYTHINRGDDLELPNRKEVIRELSYIENSLSSRLGYFFDTKCKLRDVLDEANAEEERGSFAVPTDGAIERALSLIVNPGLRFVFFSELRNPEWLFVLKDRGVFTIEANADMPAAQWPAWPEAVYLKTASRAYPELVARIITEASRVPSPVVREAAIDIALTLPMESAAGIVHLAIEWAEQGFGSDSYFWIAEEVTRLISRLLRSRSSSDNSLGKRLFQKCFEPTRSGDAFSGIEALIPRHFYSEKMCELEDAFDLLPISARRGMLNQFSKQLLYRGADGTLSSFGIASVEREIRGRSDSITGEVVYQLVRLIRISLAEDSDDAVSWFQKKEDNPLVIRCALHVCKEMLEEVDEDRRMIGESAAKFIHDVVISDLFLEDEYRPELYSALTFARKRDIVSAEELDKLIQNSYERRLVFNKTKWAGIDGFGQEEIVQATDRWIYRALSLIGSDVLGDKSRELYDRLSLGDEHEFRLELFGETETMMGPNSPVTKEEMIGLGADSLLNHLESWHPSLDDSFRLVSHEGQGRVLATAIAKSPSLFEGRIDRVLRLRPIYQRAILEGWEKSLRKGGEIPLSDAIAVLKAASTKDESEVLITEGDDFEDDPSYMNLRRSAARFAGELLGSPFVSFSGNQSDQLLDALLGLVSSSEPDIKYERKYGGGNTDPCTMAMNAIRPIALLDLAKWVRKNAGHARKTEALGMLEKHLPDCSVFESEAAAIGEALPYLYETAPSWIEGHYDKLFGPGEGNPCQQIVLTTVLALYRPSAAIYKLLSPAMIAALDYGADRLELGFRVLKKDGLSLIGHWAYFGYAAGFVSLEDPILKKWRAVADGGQLGRALGELCGSLDSSNTGVPQGIVARIGELWDLHNECFAGPEKSGSLRGAVRLAKSGCYEVSWWGPRLLRELKVNTREVPVVALRDELRALSSYDPELAVEVLWRIAEKDAHPIGSFYRDIGIELLQADVRNNGGALSEVGSRCMDALGALGCLDLDESVFQKPADN